jgi:hypothetical protein
MAKSTPSTNVSKPKGANANPTRRCRNRATAAGATAVRSLLLGLLLLGLLLLSLLPPLASC